MKLAIMQPYFLPYLGYFTLIKHADRFIIFDVVQFIRHGWIERNRILKPVEGWQYIQVPLEKCPRETKIREMRIRTSEHWEEKIFRQLEHYRKKSPYFCQVTGFLREALDYRTDSLVGLNARLLDKTCQYLGLPFRVEILSEMDLPIEPANAPDEWALNICKALGANTYLNPPGGIIFFDRSKYFEAGIELQFLKVNLKPYSQKRDRFEEGLSILDVMMFRDPHEIRSMLDDVEYL